VKSESKPSQTPPPDVRRWLCLIVAMALLVTSLVAWWVNEESSGKFLAAASGRIGIVLAALWLAWPSLRRPARWLPASAPVIGVIALIVVAAQPRLLIPAIPIVVGLITLSGLVRALRRS